MTVAPSEARIDSNGWLCLTIRQPWAWLILNAGKDIENRTWPTRVRGRVLVHAAKGCTQDEYWEAYDFARTARDEKYAGLLLPALKHLERGGVIGSVEIADCVDSSDSPWFVGDYGFVLRNPKPLPFQACKGALGFWRHNAHVEVRHD